MNQRTMVVDRGLVQRLRPTAPVEAVINVRKVVSAFARITKVAVLVVLLSVAGFAASSVPGPFGFRPPANAAEPARRILYYRAPMGPETSPVPRKDGMGMDYLPVYNDPNPQQQPAAAGKLPARRILYYRAPMSADTSPVPKQDPMGMDYVPVYDGDATADGTVTVSPERVQMLGVRTEAAREQIVRRPVRAVGTLAADERRLAILAPRFEGWIQELLVNFTGQAVTRGQPMFTFYSPDVAAAAREYLVARQLSGSIADAAAAKLRNLGTPAEDIALLARTGKVPETLTLRAPIDGVVMEKSAVQGMRFAAGDALYRIADLSTLWVQVDVFEQDLAVVRPGQRAEIRLTAYPGQTFTGTVAFIYPALNPATRTVKVRIELPNVEHLLKPDMYATVAIATDHGGRTVVAVPESAVLDSGDAQIVLVERGTGRYQPRQVVLGRRGDGSVEVTSGLAAGEMVVIAANFLIDSESNLRAALQGFTAPTAETEKRP